VSGGQRTTELISPTEDNGGIKSILLTNVHATADATVTLFIQDDPASGTTQTYNLIHTIAIPADSSLLLDNPFMFRFNDFFGLYISVESSDTVDLIIST
tara:strand:+ start:1281 stop:1577 length:297 start_codon:yes stop_codon:yes gene_type:complete